MDALLSPLLAAFACTLILLLPLALRGRATEPLERDNAWRDRLPPLLQLLRPLVRWYASSVDASLPTHKRELLQTQLNAAGAGYMLTPAEFLIIRRMSLIAGVLLAAYMYLLRPALAAREFAESHLYSSSRERQ